MKKKLSFIFIITHLIIIAVLFSSCNFTIGNFSVNNLSVSKKKTSNFYYTNLLAKNLTLEKSFKIKLVDMSFYKEKEFSNEDNEIVKGFTKELKKNNFVDKPADLPEKPLYKIFFTFSKDKYIINVYNEKYLSIYPWDGSLPMDYIDMTGVPVSYNLYSLSKYLIPR